MEGRLAVGCWLVRATQNLPLGNDAAPYEGFFTQYASFEAKTLPWHTPAKSHQPKANRQNTYFVK